jgi:hypothetical protein
LFERLRTSLGCLKNLTQQASRSKPTRIRIGLRHSFITSVGKTGATVKEHQNSARHSKPELTLGLHTHLSISDGRRALEKMPQIIKPDEKRTRAAALKTGTDDKPLDVAQGELTPKLTPHTYLYSHQLGAIEANWQKGCE